MRSPEELDDVDWAGYEDGESVPLLIRMLYQDQADVDVDGYWDLVNCVYNLGTVYPATVPAVPFLAHAALHAEFSRGRGPGPGPGRALSLLSSFTDLGEGADALCLEVRDAVVIEAPGLLPCLEYPDADLRRLTLHTLGGCGRLLGAERPLVTAAVLDIFNWEPDCDVAADALTALETLEDEAEFADRIEQALSDSDPVVRLTGLLCALEVGRVRDVAEQAEFVDEAGRLAAGFNWSGVGTRFPNLGSRMERARRQREAFRLAWRDGSQQRL